MENYLDLAKNAYNKKEFLKAVSYISIYYNINKSQESEKLYNQYKNEYLEYIKTKKYLRNRVAIYAITKNEIQFVDRGYNSMKEADYICVLDTGSTDGTYEKFVEMSKQDPRIIVSQQVFDPGRFDLPRNIAMGLIPEDANILVSTDLDEILEPGGYMDLVSNWDMNIHERASYQYAGSHNPSGLPGRVFWYNKVHTGNWIWRYPVHELLYDLVSNSTDYYSEKGVSLNKMYLHHYPDNTKSRGSYLPLLEQRVSENDDDLGGRIYLGHEYNYRGKYKESIETLKNVLLDPEIDEDLTIKASCYLFIGEDYTALGDLENAIIAYNKSIEINPQYRESYLNKAQILISQQKYGEAITTIKQALEKSVRRYSWVERDISGTYQPYDLLCLAYYYSGQKLKALACAYRAAEIEPSIDRLADNIKQILTNLNSSDG